MALLYLPLSFVVYITSGVLILAVDPLITQRPGDLVCFIICRDHTGTDWDGPWFMFAVACHLTGDDLADVIVMHGISDIFRIVVGVSVTK